MSGFAEFLIEDARLVILRELAQRSDYQLNESAITKVLDIFGHKYSREWVRTQMRKLEELGAVKVKVSNAIFVAVITRAGLDHVECRSTIEGVAKPSPEA